MIWDLEEWWILCQVCVFKSTHESPPIIDIFMSLCGGTFYTISANTCCSLEAETSQQVFTQRAGLLPPYLLTGLWVIDSCREARVRICMTHWGSWVCCRFSFRRVWNCPSIFHHLNLLHHPQAIQLSHRLLSCCNHFVQSQFYPQSRPPAATFSWVSFSCTDSSFIPQHGFAFDSNPL